MKRQKQMQVYYLIVEAYGLEHIRRQCITQLEVAEWLGVKQSAVNQVIKNNDIIKSKYRIEKIRAEADAD
jgi:predicted XRE-type DNA-binding protein